MKFLFPNCRAQSELRAVLIVAAVLALGILTKLELVNSAFPSQSLTPGHSANGCARAATFGTSPKISSEASTTTGPKSMATRG